MSKRFIDTGFLDQKWIRKLSPEKKIFLIYLMLKCDNGGIIDLDFEDASFWIGKKIDSIDFLPENYLIPLNNSSKYFMPKFVEWQYKDLTSNKYIVVQARQILEKQGLINSDFTLNLSNNHINVSKDLPKSQVIGIGIGNGNGNGNGKKGESEGKIEKREEKFRNDVYVFTNDPYPLSMLQEFCNYWTEKNKNKTKMLWEMKPTFEISRRLVTWENYGEDFKKSKKPRVDGYV
jgi:hypothetical protein